MSLWPRQEANARRIDLEEEAWVIDALLRYTHELDAIQRLDMQRTNDAAREAQSNLLIPVLKAADKVCRTP